MPVEDLLAQRRPHRADAARNFDAILLAAREVFARNHLDASLEEIARRAGVGIATLYRNFPSRADLIETVYLADVAGLCDYAGQLTGLPPWEALTAWLARFVTYLPTKVALAEALNRHASTLDVCREALYATAAPLLARAQAAGDARTDVDIDDIMRLVFAISGGVFRDDEQRTRILQVCVEGARSPRKRR